MALGNIGFGSLFQKPNQVTADNLRSKIETAANRFKKLDNQPGIDDNGAKDQVDIAPEKAVSLPTSSGHTFAKLLVGKLAGSESEATASGSIKSESGALKEANLNLNENGQQSQLQLKSFHDGTKIFHGPTDDGFALVVENKTTGTLMVTPSESPMGEAFGKAVETHGAQVGEAPEPGPRSVLDEIRDAASKHTSKLGAIAEGHAEKFNGLQDQVAEKVWDPAAEKMPDFNAMKDSAVATGAGVISTVKGAFTPKEKEESGDATPVTGATATASSSEPQALAGPSVIEPMSAEQLKDLDVQQLEGRALEGGALGKQQFNAAMEALGTLPVEEQKEAGKVLFYGAARGWKIESSKGAETPSAAQLMKDKLTMTPDEVKTFENNVFKWMGMRPQQAETFQASELRDWAVSKIDMSNINGPLGTIADNANTSLGNNTMSQESIAELYSRDKDAASALQMKVYES